MPVYFLAPILLHAAHASDQRQAVEREDPAHQHACCAAEPVGDDLGIQLGRGANPGMTETAGAASPPPELPLTFAAMSKPAEGSIAGPGPEISTDEPIAEQGTAADRYTFRVFRDQATSIPLRFGGAAAAITIGGFSNWNWGSSHFRFNSEGWFGKDTASMGMDKLGHAYSAYVLTEFFSDGIKKRSAHDRSGSYTGAILSMGLMTYIEVFDGFSNEHGFSYEDLLVDGAGALFSVVRRSVPGLRDKIDFRLLYVPSQSTWRALSCFPEPHCDRSGDTVRGPFTDYSAQRYLLALKLSGFDSLERSPLRLVEVHAGYYARGFTKEEEDRGDPLRRRLFVGLGLNVGELLFPGRRSGVAGVAKWALQYLQVPYTAVHSH